MEKEERIERDPNLGSFTFEVTMTDRAIVKWLHKIIKVWSSFHIKNNLPHQKPHWKDQWRWCCRHRDALKFAKLIIPYARVKRKKLQQIINHYDKLSLRYTNDRDVRVHHPVSRDGNHILNE